MTAAAAAPAETGRYQEIPIEALHASKTNPRTHFDQAYILELSNSILDKGLIQPIVVRPRPTSGINGTFEIVAGECRYRASKLAALARVPAIVRDMTDNQVLEAQLEENIHRKDLTPLEESAGYRRLIASNPTKHSAETIASRIGMSVSYVWDRLKLADLIPEASAILEQARISVGHAILIARLKPADQAKVLNLQRGGLFEATTGRLLGEEDGTKNKYDGYKPRTVREVEAWIARHIRFDVEHMAKAQPLEFEKTAEAVNAAAALPGRGKKVIAITFDHGPADDAKDENERTYGVESWRRADGTKKAEPHMRDAPTCDHSVLGVVTVGRDHYGKTLQVCVARDRCRVHFGDVIKAREKNAKLREAGKGKQAAKNEKKQQESYDAKWRREQAERKRRQDAWDKVRTRGLERLADALLKAGPNDAVLEAVMKTTSLYHKDDRALLARLIGKVTPANVAIAILLAVIIDDASRDIVEFRRVVKPFGVDMKDIEAEYEAAEAPPKVEKPAPAKKAAKHAGKKKR